MKENKISIIINRPVSDVFEFATNPKNTHLWIGSIVREEANEFPVRLGTVYRNVNKKGKWNEYKVTKIKSDKIFEMKQKDSSYFVRYIFESVSADKTKLTYFEWMEEGELEEPFSISTLEKLKEIMEKKE